LLQNQDKLAASQRSFFELWQSLRVGDLLPQKGDFGPKNLRSLSAWFAMLCENEHGELYISFSGTALDDIWGRNVTGDTLDDTTLKERRVRVRQFFDEVIQHPCGGFVSETFSKDSGAELLANALYLPIETEAGRKGIVSVWDVVGPGSQRHARLPRTCEIDGRLFHQATYLDVGHGVPDMASD